jgi:hypothetical protein
MITRTSQLKLRTDALIVFCLLTLCYAYFYQDGSWNGNSRLAATVAMVKEGRFSIDSYFQDPTSGLETGDMSIFQGIHYSDKAPGSAFFAAIFFAPLYWITHWLGIDLDIFLVKHLLTFLALGLPSAGAGTLVYLFCEQVSGSQLRSFVVATAVTLGTLSFPFSMIFFGHQLAASFLFSAFFLIFRLKTRPGPAGKANVFAVGLLLGLALITEYTTALIVLPLIVYYFWILWQKRSLFSLYSILLPLLGGLLPLALTGVYNTICFGGPFSIGYENLVRENFQIGMSSGIMGVNRPSLRVLFFETFHPAMGLFWQSPVLLMTILGGWLLLRSKTLRLEGMLAGFIALAMLIMNAGYYMWWGGHSVGPRNLIPMLPFLCILLIFVPRSSYFILIPLDIVSIFQMIVASASHILVPADQTFQNLKFAGFFDYSTIYNYCWWKLTNGVFDWNLGQGIFHLETWASLIPLVLALAATAVYFWMATAQPKGRRSFPTPVE